MGSLGLPRAGDNYSDTGGNRKSPGPLHRLVQHPFHPTE